MRTIDVPLRLLGRLDYRACAVRVDRRVATFDLDSAGWQQLYRSSREKRPRPIPPLPVASDEEIAALYERDNLGGCGC